MANHTIGEMREAFTKNLLEDHAIRIANQYKSRFKYVWMMVNMEIDQDDHNVFRQSIGVTNVKPQPKYGMLCIRLNTHTAEPEIEWNLPKNKCRIILPDEYYSDTYASTVTDTVKNLPRLIG